MGYADQIKRGNPVVLIKSGDAKESFREEDGTIVSRMVPLTPEDKIPDVYCVPGKEGEMIALLARMGVINLWRPEDEENMHWQKEDNK